MKARTTRRLSLIAVLVTPCFIQFPAAAQAQWVPRAGDGSVTVGYEYSRVTSHLFSVDLTGYVDPTTGYVGGPGKRMYLGDVYGQSVNTSVSYGIWRGLAIDVNGTYESSKYFGRAAEAATDDGHYHGSLQDATVGLQYMNIWRGFAITPSVGFRFPLSNYSTIGHVAVGTHLHEVPVGIAVGRALDPFLPRAYLAGSFTYAFVENVHEYTLDQHRYELDAGYIVTDDLAVGGALTYASTVDGIDWALDDFSQEDVAMNHDLAAKAKYVRIGAHASYRIASDFSLGAYYVGTLSGENTHSAQSIMFAPTWSFHAPILH